MTMTKMAAKVEGGKWKLKNDQELSMLVLFAILSATSVCGSGGRGADRAASSDKLFFDSIRYRYDMRVFLSIRYDTIRYTPLLTLRSPWWWPALCAETMKM